MKINFNSPILDLDDEPVYEVKRDKNTLEPILTKEELPQFRNLQEAQSLGYINVTTDGTKVVRVVPEKSYINLAIICINALMQEWQDEKLTADQTFERWEMAKRLKNCSKTNDYVLDLDKDDRKLILTATDNYKTGAKLYFARARELLSTEYVPTPKKEKNGN